MDKEINQQNAQQIALMEINNALVDKSNYTSKKLVNILNKIEKKYNKE